MLAGCMLNAFPSLDSAITASLYTPHCMNLLWSNPTFVKEQVEPRKLACRFAVVLV